MIAFNYHGAERVHPCSVLGMLSQRSIINSTRMNFYLFAQMFRENGFVTHIAG
jgi:hypothetical protein